MSKLNYQSVLFIFFSIFILGGIFLVFNTATAQTPNCSFTRDLSLGSRGTDVNCLQRFLTARGFFGGTTTEYFGPATQSAVINWQRSRRITPAQGYFGSTSRAAYNDFFGESASAEISANTNSTDSTIDTERSQLQEQVRQLMRQVIALLQEKLAQTLDRAGIDRSQFADALGDRVASESSSNRSSSGGGNRNVRLNNNSDSDNEDDSGGGGGGGGSSGNGGSGDNDDEDNGDSTNYLVNDGNAVADIVVANDAPNMVNLAAEYFQSDIEDMTGATLSINNAPDDSYDFHVYIGQSEYTDDLGITAQGTEYDGYKIVSGEDYLVMIGDDTPYDVDVEMTESEWDSHTAPDVFGNSQSAWRQEHRTHNIYSRDGRGSMNAIHDFLEEQGMRYYYPTDFGTITPDKEDIAFEQVNKTVNPAFAMRSPYHWYKRFRHLSNQGLFLDNGDFGTKEEWTRFLLSMGLNHEQSVVIGQVAHGLNEVTERDETKQAHPEYYAVWGGERKNGDDQKQNLCSPELKQATIRYVRTMIDTYGHLYSGSKYISLWPADGFTRVSEHNQECRDKATPEYGNDGRISDYVWNFINDVAWEIHDEYGDGHYIMGGAYSAYKLPPQDIENPRGFAPNLSVMIAHNRYTTADSEQKEYREQLVSDWDEIAPGQVFMNDKYLYNQVGGTGQSVPHFFPEIISEDFKFLEGKVNGEFDEVATNLPWRDTTHDAYAATGLNMYITSRMFWNPDADVDEILDEYYDLYYGPAAQQMQELVEYSQDNLRNDFVTDPTHLNTMREMAEEALTQVPNNSDYEERIQTLLGLMNAVYTGEEVVVQECQDLTSPGTNYVLNQPVSSNGQCFFIDQNGITLDCKGFTIASEDDGVHIDARQSNRGNYYTIKNCDIDSASGHGIYASNADNGLIENNNIEAGKRGMWVSASENVTIRDNYSYSETDAGAYIQVGSSDGSDALTRHTVEDNIFETDSGSATAFYNNDGDTIRNNEFIANSGIAVRMYNPENTTFSNNVLQSVTGQVFQLSNPLENFTQEDNTMIEGVQGARTTNVKTLLDRAMSKLLDMLDVLKSR